MKMLVYSDLHLDLHPLDLKLDPDFLRSIDVVVLAGDIAEGTRGLRWAREAFPDKAIVSVAGNHEFYGQHWDQHLDVMRQVAHEREIHYLENNGVTIGGVKFLGCTLWTDFALYAGESKLEAMSAARQGMNDYQRIKISPHREMYWQRRHRLFPALVARRHEVSRNWLEEQLSQGSPQRTVVVTHHAPHPKSIPPEHMGHGLSPSYASDLEPLMGKARMWIHGHIHESADYEVRGTRILSNPRGYVVTKKGEMQNPVFRTDFHVSIETLPFPEFPLGGSTAPNMLKESE